MAQLFIHSGLEHLEDCIPSNSETFVIIDNNLKRYKEYFKQFRVIEIETNEHKKTLQTVEFLASRLLELGADRDCFILGVGGGITTDIVGFTASIYKRGVQFGFVPTTLLAQVDASIGGKNGVNLHSYKNIIGVINQPNFVYLCSDVLKTLPPREFRAGISEVLKTFILFDRDAYARAVAYFSRLEKQLVETGSYFASPASDCFFEQETLTELIGLCAKYKSEVVARDAFEKGERRLLNLGHTYAHAIEQICGAHYGDFRYPGADIMHGEAVSIGLVLAGRMAERFASEKCSAHFSTRLYDDLKAVGLPVEIPPYITLAAMNDAIVNDKKVSGGHLHFILPYGLEKVEDIKIPLNQLKELSHDLC